MNRKTTSLAILLAASIALALGTMTAGPVHAQCGDSPNQEPCENEKKVRRTEIPPTATFTPTPEPTATPTPTLTPTATPTLPSIPALAPERADAAPTGDWLPAVGAGLALILGLGMLAFRLYTNFRGPPGTHRGGEGRASFSDVDLSRNAEPYSSPPRKNPSRRSDKDSGAEARPDFGGLLSGSVDAGARGLDDADPQSTPEANPPDSSLDAAPDHLPPISIPDLPEGLGDLALWEHDATKDTLAIQSDLTDTTEEGTADSSDEDSSEDPET